MVSNSAKIVVKTLMWDLVGNIDISTVAASFARHLYVFLAKMLITVILSKSSIKKN